MKRLLILIFFCFLVGNHGYGQSLSLQTYINPIIPGDHPDPTLTKIGDHFYTSGSSFNPTPKIYHSTDLVHWEVIAIQRNLLAFLWKRRRQYVFRYSKSARRSMERANHDTGSGWYVGIGCR
ncbi:MAG: family 43 glycosylhydrolase [candidate division WOR-3 bacterium]